MAVTKTEDAISKALSNLNIKWCREDLEGVLQDSGIPVTDENLIQFSKLITSGFSETLVAETFERLGVLADQINEIS